MITPQQLVEIASALRVSTPELVAVGLLKEAGYSDVAAKQLVAQETMEKTAASGLVDKGFDYDEAVKMVKAANVDVASLENLSLESEEEALADILEKAAQTIDALQSELDASHEKTASFTEPAAPLPDSITRLATSGSFTNEDLDALMNLSPETLVKVAAAVDEPWTMGKAAGVERPVTDPLLEFMLS